MAMDAKDLRIDSVLGARSDNGNTKYAQSATGLQSNGNKPYQDIGPNSLAKVDVQTARPCAIIGPDRIVPPQSTSDAYLKKIPVEPWPCANNLYQHPPEYPHKHIEYQPSRNISPRQTFQENMQRIMVPPSYASTKSSDEHCLKNPKLMTLESKFCDVPYMVSPINNETKTVKTSEGLLPHNNLNQSVLSHNWAGSSVNVRPLGPYGAPELYQYSEYTNYPGPRPISMIRPHRNFHEDVPQVYQERFYHEANIRFKPYPTTKERQFHHPQARYEYIPNYPSVFHPHTPYPPHKYDLQKSMPTHSYSVYPPVPLKYLDRRMPVPAMDKFTRSPGHKVNFNSPFCNQNIASTYGSVPGNCVQNRGYSYAPDPSTKHMIQNKIYLDSSNAHKYYNNSENMLINDINRPPTLKNDVLYPPYAPMQSIPPQQMYRKEGSIKGYEKAIHYRNIEYPTNLNPLGRFPLQFLPQTMSISSDCNTSNDTTQIVGNTQDDFGYFNQTSTTNRIPSNIYRRHDMRHGGLTQMNKSGQTLHASTSSKERKDLDVRQFLQMWNEGDDEGSDNKDSTRQRDSSKSLGQYESGNKQEQLYVLDLVNVPSEDLGKYDHIQKISKLPENIKGYNSIEILNQYEKLIESPGLNHFSVTTQTKQKDLYVPMRNGMLKHGMEVASARARPMSPLDVEAKISQSVIHKDVGCNFEIRPCSPQMMSVELATPIHNVLGERLIEKVVNPVTIKSPLHHHRMEETSNNSSPRISPKVTSCKMANNQYTSPNINDSLKTNYSLQDLESNSGVCLASLPRLDNDIELNFPEINQQFINANKISSIQDLPILDVENSGTTLKNESKNHNQAFVLENLHSGSESDKEVSKLSKYRKHKRNSVPNENSETSNVSLHRTDSVIIKNPENGKSQEEHTYNVPLVNNNESNSENIVKPVNIPVESDRAINYSDKNFTEAVCENINDYTLMDVNDAAIDFSMNKSDDEQSINTINNLSDVLPNDIEIDGNSYIESETTTTNNNNKEVSNQLEELSASDNILIPQPKSPTLCNSSCTNVSIKDTNLQSIDGGNEILQSHETVITCSNPKAPESNESLLNVTTEKRLSRNNLSSSSHEIEKTAPNVTICNSILSENNSALSSDVNNQVLNYSLTENSNDVIIPKCESNVNLGNETENDYISMEDINKGNNCCTEEKQQSTLRYEDVDRNEIYLDNENLQNLPLQESKSMKTQSIPIEPEVISDTTPISEIDKEFFELESPSVLNKEAIDLKTYDNFDFNIESRDRDNVHSEVTDTNKKSIIETCNSNIESILTNDFNSIKIPGMEMDDFENNDMFSKTSEDNTNVDKETKILPSLFTKKMSIGKSYFKEDSYKVMHSVILKKELFSPRLQNLLLYSEGNCASLNSDIIHDVKETTHRLYDNSHRLQLEDDNLDIISKLDDKRGKPESEDNSNNTNTTKTSSALDADKLRESDHDTNIITESKPINNHVNITSIDVDNVIITTNDKTKNFVLENDQPETLPKVHKSISNEVVTNSENNINFNIKLGNDVIECTPVAEHLKSNQLSNRRNRTLKRSLSESAVDVYTDNSILKGNCENFVHGRKRPKITDSEILVESEIITNNFTSFIQGNRRNSISTIYNDENVSFCIVIDNDCVLTEENESCQKICYTELSTECLATICTEGDTLHSEVAENITFEDTNSICDEEGEEVANSDLPEYFSYENDLSISTKIDIPNFEDEENVPYEQPEQCRYENDFILQSVEDKTIGESWVEDVACMETVFSDDIAEDIVITSLTSPKDIASSEEESEANSSFVYNDNENEHTNKVKYIYGSQMCYDDAQLVEKLYRTPQMNVNKTLIDRESQASQGYNGYYDSESLEKILSESNSSPTQYLVQNDLISNKSSAGNINCDDVHGNKENLNDLLPKQESRNEILSTKDLSNLLQTTMFEEKKKEHDDSVVYSCESSRDNFVSFTKEEKLQYSISSSPEVSSTTSEEKGPGILLKIRSYKGSKISEVNDMRANFNHTNSQRFNSNSLPTSRPLITKAAQKYIPPLKETIRDLKVKIRLPKQSLYKLQQLKNSKEEPKIETSRSKHYIKNLPRESTKKAKPKPNFEDVLMSIDEIQFKKHKEKNKKPKQSVPKVIIKKNENGAHYASTQNKESFNPDLTGRKWQPWVFLEKSNFVDKMALKQKFKAIYSHRKKTFVLAEKFRKYKSISNAKFVISHPKCNDNNTTGKLKYTFRLKHT